VLERRLGRWRERQFDPGKSLPMFPPGLVSRVSFQYPLNPDALLCEGAGPDDLLHLGQQSLLTRAERPEDLDDPERFFSYPVPIPTKTWPPSIFSNSLATVRTMSFPIEAAYYAY
jgi:hypothetical protein